MDERTPDRETLEKLHTPSAISRRLADARVTSYLGDFVLGAVDGAVTTFAIVAGAIGAEVSSRVIIVLGIANVIADGFSMAAGNFLKSRADGELVERYRRIEEMHIDEIPEGEREEVRQILESKGFTGELLEQAIDTITAEKQRWVNFMLTEEWGLPLAAPSPYKSAGVTFVAFLGAGLIPLAPLIFVGADSAEGAVAFSVALTMLAFWVVGWHRGRLSDQSPWVAAFETVALGGGAAILAFLVGRLLRNYGIE